MADGREEKDCRPQHLKPRDSGLPDSPARRPAPPYVAPPGYVAPIPEEPAPVPAARQPSPPPERQPSSDEDDFQEAHGEQHPDEAEEQPADDRAPDNEDNDDDPEEPHDEPVGNEDPVPPPAADMAQPQAVQPNQLTLLPTFDGVRGCLLYTSPSPRDLSTSRMPSSA